MDSSLACDLISEDGDSSIAAFFADLPDNGIGFAEERSSPSPEQRQVNKRKQRDCGRGNVKKPETRVKQEANAMGHTDSIPDLITIDSEDDSLARKYT